MRGQCILIKMCGLFYVKLYVMWGNLQRQKKVWIDECLAVFCSLYKISFTNVCFDYVILRDVRFLGKLRNLNEVSIELGIVGRGF